MDTEFFLQLFVEKSETTLFTMQEMLFKCMREQNITFAEVFIRILPVYTVLCVSAFIVLFQMLICLTTVLCLYPVCTIVQACFEICTYCI